MKNKERKRKRRRREEKRRGREEQKGMDSSKIWYGNLKFSMDTCFGVVWNNL